MIRFVFLNLLTLVLLLPLDAMAAQGSGDSSTSVDSGEGRGCIDRSQFAQELESNPNCKKVFCQLMKIEVKASCGTAWAETVMNRAYARGKGVCYELTGNKAYWQTYPSAGSAMAPGCTTNLNTALAGSNQSNLATDNASNYPGDPTFANRYNAQYGTNKYGNVWCGGAPNTMGPELFYAKKQYEKKLDELAAGMPDVSNCKNPPNITPPDPNATESTPTKTPAEVQASFNSQSQAQAHFNDLSAALKAIWVATLQIMTSQLSAIMMEQTLAIGTFFDAKHQLESQRLMQEKLAQAHKDYQPSEQMCTVGTFVRNLANTEKRAELTKTAMAQSAINRELATGEVSTLDANSDPKTKMTAYLDKFCSPFDNGNQNQLICNNKDLTRVNADINYTQTIDRALTIPLNMLDGETKPEEENLFMMLDYIFMNDRSPWVSKSIVDNIAFREPYQNMRSLTAMRSVAQNSFAHIIGEKTESPENSDESNAPFIKALLKEMGVKDDEIERTIGKNPSYYAQMEVLTKKIYQDPKFIVNLYDKPANVKRLKAAMTAIKLMQDRDIHNAMMRREMLMSMLLELQLRRDQQDLLRGELNQVLESQPLPNNPAGNGQGTNQGF